MCNLSTLAAEEGIPQRMVQMKGKKACPVFQETYAQKPGEREYEILMHQTRGKRTKNSQFRVPYVTQQRIVDAISEL